jgi:hypothetical protein
MDALPASQDSEDKSVPQRLGSIMYGNCMIFCFPAMTVHNKNRVSTNPVNLPVIGLRYNFYLVISKICFIYFKHKHINKTYGIAGVLLLSHL